MTVVAMTGGLLRLWGPHPIILSKSENFKNGIAMKSETKQASEKNGTCSQDREQWIRRSIDQAIAENKSLLQLVVSVPNPSADPWSALPSGRDATPFIAWNDPKRGQCILARGRLITHEAQGPDRFNTLHKKQVELSAQRLIASDRPLSTPPPLAFAGFAFAERPSQRSSPWQDWPNSLLLIPKEIVLRDQSDPQSKICKIIINTHISKDSPNSFLLSKRIEEIEKELQNAPARSPAGPNQGPLQATPLEEEQAWHQRVNAVADAARATYLDKVVLARAVEFQAPKRRFDRNQTLLKLRDQHPGSITFAIALKGRAFLGSTPETLIHLEKGSFETHALAGTIKRSDTPGEEGKAGEALLQSSKDRREQNIVTQALVKALQPLSRELQVDQAPKLRQLPKVLHLETKLSGRLVSEELFQSSHIFTLLSHMHPTPAVGGHPFGRARQWLEDREALERGWYAGPIGWVDGQGNGCFAVAIRSALLSEDRALAYAGAGIVADSEPSLEWQETSLKFETIRSALVLSDQAEESESGEPEQS